MDINVKKEILEHLNIIQNLINEAPVTKSDEPETKQPKEIALKDMPQGSVFVFQEKEFIKHQKLRTCLKKSSGTTKKIRRF